MSIVPVLYLVIGIDNIQKNDERRIKNVDIATLNLLSTVKYYSDDMETLDSVFKRFHGKTLCDLIYNPYGAVENQVVGFIKEKVFNQDFIRALVALNPDWIEGFVKQIPEQDPNDCEHSLKRYGFTQEDIDCHRLMDFVFASDVYSLRIDWKRAVHYLKQVGWNVEEKDLHYFLILDWA